MKHLLTSLAICTAAISGYGFDYSVSPTPGVVESLTSVTITANCPNFDEIEIFTLSDIVVNKDGELFCGVTKAANGNSMIFTLKTPATEPGTYTFYCPANNMAFWYDNYEGYDENDAEISHDYIIEGSGTSQNVEYSFSPETGTVESLTSVTLTASHPNFDEIEVMTLADIVVNKDGELFCGVTKADNGNSMVFTLKTPATEPGTYTFYCPANNIAFWYDGYEGYEEIETPISIEYVIEGSGTSQNVEYSFSPETGTVESLTSVTLTASHPNFDEIEVMTLADIVVNKDGELFCGVTKADNGNSMVFTLKTPATEPGTYTFYCPANNIAFWYDGYEGYEEIETPINIEYVIEGSDPGEEVVYDVTIASTKPAAGVVDMSQIQFESIIITTTDSDIKPREDAYIILASEDGTYNHQYNLKYNFGKQLISWITVPPTINGNYTLTIPKGAIGDAAYLSNNATGHANDEIVVNYEFIGLDGPSDPVVFDIVPESITPENGKTVTSLTQVTIGFGDSVFALDGLTATLKCPEADYEVTGYANRTFGPTFIFTFDPAPMINGSYTFTVAQGAFGNSDYYGDQTTGHATEEITAQYTLISESGVGLIDTEDNEDYFTITGINIGSDSKVLSPGIYIHKGKKIVIR